MHRREFLLSGLLVCGCCGGGYTVVAQDRYGCATRKGRGTCDNAKTIKRQNIEKRVLGALKHHLVSPAKVDDATLQRTTGRNVSTTLIQPGSEFKLGYER